MKVTFLIVLVTCLTNAYSAMAQMSSVEIQRNAADKQTQQTKEAMTASVSAQMKAVRAAAKVSVQKAPPEPAFFIFDPELSAASSADAPSCDAMSPIAAQALASRAATANQISPDLVFAVMRQESAFVPCAVSSKGALGLMQLLPGTAEQLGVGDPLDAEQNVLGGAKYLKQLFTRYAGDLNRTLGAYNAGPGNVDSYDGVPPFPETLNYVDSILSSLQPAAH